jgi:hypothetical protein
MRRQYPHPTELDMNCIPGLITQSLSIIAAGLLVSVSATAAESESLTSGSERVYGVDYRITPNISRAGAYVQLTVAQNQHLLRELSMPNDPNVISEIDGDGQLVVDEERIRWQPGSEGGQLSWFAKVNHRRNGDGYDAFIGEDWALFRAEDVIPPTATRTLRRSLSKTRLMFELPNGWTAVSEYFQRSGVHNVSNPDRRFDKPTGWIVLGHLGVRNETIAGVRVVVAAPVDQSVRRLDMLAMFNWNLPDLLRLLPGFPKRLTVVSAGEPMWRGALSAPRSFYVHTERPLISENGTSTIMHEAIHIGLSVDAVRGADWIVEGLAEYYGLEILRRSGTISEKRYISARSRLATWGKKAKSLCADPSTGAVTARAVSLLSDLNDEISKKSNRKYDLDDLARRVAKIPDKISVQQLRDIAQNLLAAESEVLSDKSLNNCEN